MYLVMQKAPISWGPILNLETICSTSLLYSRATDHELALVHATKYESSNIITSDNLLYTLRRLGIQVDRNHPFERLVKLVTSKESKNDRGEEVIHEAFLGSAKLGRLYARNQFRSGSYEGSTSSPEKVSETPSERGIPI